MTWWPDILSFFGFDSKLKPEKVLSMELSKKGLQHIFKWEGYREHVYKDVAGLPTIGVGHLLTETEKSTGQILFDLKAHTIKKGLSKANALKLLNQDSDNAIRCVKRRVKQPLLQHQFDILVSFVFNLGCGNFTKSTLLKRINEGSFDSAANELLKWVYADGAKSRGLVNRRVEERLVFKNGF